MARAERWWIVVEIHPSTHKSSNDKQLWMCTTIWHIYIYTYIIVYYIYIYIIHILYLYMMILVLETLNRKRNRIHNIPWPSKVSGTCSEKHHQGENQERPKTPCLGDHTMLFKPRGPGCWLPTYKDSSGHWCQHQVLPLMWLFHVISIGQISGKQTNVHSTWKDGHLGTCVINTKD